MPPKKIHNSYKKDYLHILEGLCAIWKFVQCKCVEFIRTENTVLRLSKFAKKMFERLIICGEHQRKYGKYYYYHGSFAKWVKIYFLVFFRFFRELSACSIKMSTSMFVYYQSASYMTFHLGNEEWLMQHSKINSWNVKLKTKKKIQSSALPK